MTKEQLAYINGLDSKKEIKRQINEWFGEEPKLIIGNWYKSEYYLINKQDNNNCYGFNLTDNNWIEKVSHDLWNHICGNYIQATDKEVEEALIKEAVKRGYKLGVYIKGMDDGERCKLFGDIKLFGNDCLNIGYDIFRIGKWAEIIETISKE